MQKIRSIIVEDEQDNRLNLKVMLQSYCPNIEVVAEAENVAEGLKTIRQYQPELVFLDVEMPDGSGFDLLARVGKPDFRVIFVTAYSQYAIKAIKFNAMDYILKPIDISELCLAVDKVSHNMKNNDSIELIQNLLGNIQHRDLQSRRIPLASADSLRMVELSQVVRLQGENNYTRFFLADGTNILVSKTLKDYDSMLESNDFIRVHQSHIVNLSFVKSFIKTDGGYLVMEDGSEVGVSRAKKQDLLDRLYGG
ncbi:MAG: response regulator transcription factor [Bacteroidia bacterium]|nr:response regulator transcription factor [Bacteroidia bacterium]